MKLRFQYKVMFALVGIFLVSVGVAFNASAMLGNDPVAIIYDGIRNFAGLEVGQLGLVSNFVNYALIIILFFTGRKYLNVGTLIYILPYGFFVNIGTNIYNYIFHTQQLYPRIGAVVLGCLAIYTGVAIYIAMNIGLDPFTGVVMNLADTLGWDFRKTKITFDVTMVIVGTLLGGKLGIITVITAFTAGPSIQGISNWIINSFPILKKDENRS